MNINKAFSFPFEDKQWISKLGIGAVIGMVPILNFAWNGYLVGILRNVISNAEEPLPNWDNFEKKFMDGLILFAAGLVYSLPILLVVCLPMGFMGISGVLSGNGDFQDVGEVLAGVGGILGLCLGGLFFVYAILLSIVYPAILVLFAREGTFASCFKFREVIDLISKNAGSFFTAWGVGLLAALGVGLVAGIVSAVLGWIPCVGWIVALVASIGSTIYGTVIYAHLFGQFGAMAVTQN
jgi:hypothetical protein